MISELKDSKKTIYAPNISTNNQLQGNTRDTSTAEASCLPIYYRGYQLNLDFSLDFDPRFIEENPQHNLYILKNYYPKLFDAIVNMPKRDGTPHTPNKCFKAPINLLNTTSRVEGKASVASTTSKPKTFLEGILDFL